MLALNRNVDQSIIIEANGKIIEVKVLSVSGPQVCIGVKADKEVKIDREEIRERKQKGNKHER